MSKPVTALLAAFVAVVIFIGGFVSGLFVTLVNSGASYTQEHAVNGKLMLIALDGMEREDNEPAKTLLQSEIASRVVILNMYMELRSERERTEIEHFYKALLTYYKNNDISYREALGDKAADILEQYEQKERT